MKMLLGILLGWAIYLLLFIGYVWILAIALFEDDKVGALVCIIFPPLHRPQ